MDINFSLDGFFQSENYQLTLFEYKDIKFELFSLQSSTTDFDLTGQIIWPSAIELAKYIIDNQNLFKDKVVLELGTFELLVIITKNIGAGAGLCGLVAAHFAKKVIITDGNELVQRLIKKNVQMLNPTVFECVFQWGKENSKELLKQLKSDFGEELEIDVIIGSKCLLNMYEIGADIIFWPQSVSPLIETIQHFTGRNPTKILVGGIKRYPQVEDDIDSLLKEIKLERVEVLTNANYSQLVYIYEILSVCQKETI